MQKLNDLSQIMGGNSGGGAKQQTTEPYSCADPLQQQSIERYNNTLLQEQHI